jgi:murein hydrolase activator
MSGNRWNILFVTLLLLLIPFAASAQGSRKDLEKKRKQKEKEIKLTQKILDQTRSQKKKTLNELNLLDKQIKMREELIGTIGDELIVVDGQIAAENSTLENLGRELKRMKDEYADMVYRAYKMRESGDLASYVLAADNFNQAIKRIKYVQQVSEDRERQLELIKHMQDSISGQLDRLKKIKKEKGELLTQHEGEKKELDGDKKENEKLVQNLQQKEKELKSDIKEKEKAAKKLDDQIRKLIQEEIERERKRNAKKNDKKGDKKPTKSGEMELTPEGAALAKEFSANKAKLPWPTERGIIVRKFGTYAHPELKGITIVNNGIDIATVKGTKARCVFEGEVRSVFFIPGMQKAVMVKHGNYFTVYTHPNQILINHNDKVKTKQDLGIIYTDTEEGKTTLHFEVWQNSNNLNPELWLADK